MSESHLEKETLREMPVEPHGDVRRPYKTTMTLPAPVPDEPVPPVDEPIESGGVDVDRFP